MTDQPSEFLSVRNLTRVFDISRPWLNRVLERLPRQRLTAVNNVSFDIPRGKTFALVGESGSGKSTVARLIVGLLEASSGDILFHGKPLNPNDRQQRQKVQMIFQDPFASLNPRWRVGDIIAEPLHAFGLVGGNHGPASEQVKRLLETVGLSATDGAKYPHEFSGGQRQRIAIARALSARPEFLVCDEPTSALDVSVQAQILNLMRDLQDEFNLTYLFISHDMSVVRHMADRVGVLYLGGLVELADSHSLFSQPNHPYTRMLLDAIPDPTRTGRQREKDVQGEIPNPIDPPSGCVFHPRCPFANERCRREIPDLTHTGGDRVACFAVEEERLPPYRD